MIEVDFDNLTYICPFCLQQQAFSGSAEETEAIYNSKFPGHKTEDDFNNALSIYHIKCRNRSCKRTTIVVINDTSKKQWDIIPEVVYRHYPDYIPQQIRDDYVEACLTLDRSPKAAATLFRRCLQGMIRDFHGITKDKLADAINELQGKVTALQWKAIDGLRKVGNIGAHMEKDVNLIVDIDPDEADKLKKLIELLLDKWYIARHEEEALCAEVAGISDSKQAKRKGSE